MKMGKKIEIEVEEHRFEKMKNKVEKIQEGWEAWEAERTGMDKISKNKADFFELLQKCELFTDTAANWGIEEDKITVHY